MTLHKVSTTPETSYQMYIGGRWVDAEGGRSFPSVDPASGAVWAKIPEASDRDVDKAVRAAAEASTDGPWSTMSATKRGQLLYRLASLVEQNAEGLAEIETRDNGKLLKEMRVQLRSVPNILTYYAGLADKVEGATIPADRVSIFSYTLREPLGIVAAITPWNSPVYLATHKLAPALAAGNALVIKPSEFASASTLEFARLIDGAGFPAGVVNVVTGSGPTTGMSLVSHPAVSMVSFTGSRDAGCRIAITVAQRGQRYALELGGKSPNIVFEDADLDRAEAGLVAGIFAATGQTCVAGSRALIHRSVYDEMCERLARRAREIQLGDPMDPSTQMGPLATQAQLEKVDRYARIARNDGGVVLAGGDRAEMGGPLSSGFYYQPTVLNNVPLDSKVMKEEVFGPVLCMVPFDTEDEAVQLANATEYGLAAGVWTNDLNRAHRMVRRLEVGTVWVNTYRVTSFNFPHGGYKASGVGKERGKEAINAYLQTKTVLIETSDEVQDPFVIRN